MEDSTGGNTAASAPTSFATADWSSDASPAPESSQQTTTPSAAEQPTAASEPAPAGDDRSPFIPRARFDEVNTKANELKQWREQYAWAESVDRQKVEQAVELANLYSTDRAGYIRTLLSEAINDPQLAPAIRSEAARLLGTRAQSAPTPDAPVQMVPVQLEDGTVVNMPRDPNAWMAQQRASLQAEMDAKYAPALSAADKLQKAEEHYAQSQEAQRFATSFGGDLTKLPHFAELKDTIREGLSKAQLASDHPAEVRAAALQVYIQALSEKVLPNLSTKAQSQLLDSLQQKAAASNSVNPGSAAPSTPRSVTKFTDASLQW
jgi:hypothetical protein